MRPFYAVVFFALALLTRLPFLTENLYEHDSVLYARALESFDPTAQRPHPPGYLWYVLLVRAAALVVDDPNRAMTVVSAVAGAGAVALLYALASRIYDERTGRLAAMFLLTSVSFWARGIVAYPYTLLALLTVLVALLLWRVVQALSDAAAGRRLVAATTLWGIAIGFRTDLGPALAPLWILAACLARPPRRHLAIAAASGAAGVGAWLAATAALTPGGLGGFLGAIAAQSSGVAAEGGIAQGLDGIAANARALGRYLLRGLYALIPLIVAAAALRGLTGPRRSARDAFVLVWVLAPLPYYLLVHVGEYGHVFTMLPGLVILAARGATLLAQRIRWTHALPATAGAAILANALLFLVSDTPLSARDIARRDRGITEKAAWIERNLDPDRTVIVTAYDRAVIEYYLGRDHPVVVHDPASPDRLDVACPRAGGCAAGTSVVLWDDLLPAAEGWSLVKLPSGATLRSAAVEGQVAVRHDARGRLRPGR